jgi:hypothetical protein
MSTDGTLGLVGEFLVRKISIMPETGKKFLRVVYDEEALPLLPSSHPPQLVAAAKQVQLWD